MPAVLVESERFGTLEVTDDLVIHFAEGADFRAVAAGRHLGAVDESPLP